MALALDLAQRAADADEVPVGAVLVSATGETLATGWNRPVADCDPTAHAEIIALREAARVTGNYRLPNTTLYVTLEPCVMCAGAIVHARVAQLIYGASDPGAGAVHSVFGNPAGTALNHVPMIQGGIMATECAALLKAFFSARRGPT